MGRWDHRANPGSTSRGCRTGDEVADYGVHALAPFYKDHPMQIASIARPRFNHAQISVSGKIHMVTHVIIRWNFLGGTYTHPDVTVCLACGPQSHWVHPVWTLEYVCPSSMCARCRNYEGQERWRRLREGSS